MPSRLGWTRAGTRRPFRYLDEKGRPIRDPEVLERLESLAIPPAWKDVRISPSARARLQATSTSRTPAIPLPPGLPRDFRTWGGTLTFAIAFAERGPVEGKTEQKRAVAVVSTAERSRIFVPEFARRLRARYRPRPRGKCDAVAAPLLANTRDAQSGLVFAVATTYNSGSNSPSKEEFVARKTVLVCDDCGKEVDEGRGAVLRLTYTDARRGAKQADLCDECAGRMPGAPAARRGRRPKVAAV
jgi:hypothetical protein